MKKVMLVAMAILCFLMVGEVQAQCTFSDVPESHNFYDYVTGMCELGITTGYPDGTFRPGNNVTRGQMSAFIMRTIESLQLACVTASIEKGPIGNGDYTVEITNAKNITVSDWSQVVHVNVRPNPEPGEWGYYFGLFCNDDWLNTGCSQTMDQDSVLPDEFDLDIDQYNNGCDGDNEEYEFVKILTTCCKIVAN